MTDDRVEQKPSTFPATLSPADSAVYRVRYEASYTTRVIERRRQLLLRGVLLGGGIGLLGFLGAAFGGPAS